MPVHTVPHFETEAGASLQDAPVAYRTWGRLDEDGRNAIVVCHALTGSQDIDDWWGPLLGPGRPFDTDQYFVVGLNVPGSPYGSVSPLTENPATGRPYASDFPAFTIRDTVRLHRHVLDAIGVRQIALAVGGSMGGMQALEWAFEGDFVRAICPMAVGGRHSAWCIGWSEAQRQAIYADPKWRGGAYPPNDPPRSGLAAARMMAMVSYRSQPSFEAKFGRGRMEEQTEEPFAVESYLRYQGQKLVDRFDANCYVSITRQMDTHDVSRGRGEYGDVLASIEQPALVLGVDSDVLYPLREQKELADGLARGELGVLASPHGHDAFLIEFDQMARLLEPWMERNVSTRWTAGSRPARNTRAGSTAT